jgi:hypothetical protein
MKILKAVNLFYIMSESGVVTEVSRLGSRLLSIAEVAAKFSVIADIVTTIAVSTTQATCLANDIYNRMKNAFSTDIDEVRQALAIYPALSTAVKFTRSPVTNLQDLVRHGIIVQTIDDQTNRPIYFYIGGVSSAWVSERRIQKLLAFQGSSRFTLTTAVFNEQIQLALSSKYPIIVAPLRPAYKYPNFVNPPNTSCQPNLPSDVLNAVQSASLGWATFIPNYVGSIIGLLSRFSPNFYYKSSNNLWNLNSVIEAYLQAISAEPPLFYEGLAVLPQLGQFGLGTIDIYNNYAFDFTNTKPPFANLFLGNPFPLLNGAPAYTDMLCTGNCSGLGLAGFVVAPGGLVSPTEVPDVLQAQLIPPPNNFTFQGIMDYASQLGQYTWVDQLLQYVRKAFKVISILVSNFGWLEQEAEKAVYALEWFGSEFEKSAEEIAQDIVNEFSKPEHSESEHTDEAGMEVHNAYMCARFGLCG